LAYFNVVVKSWKGEIVLGIYSRAIKVVAIKKAYNVRAHFTHKAKALRS